MQAHVYALQAKRSFQFESHKEAREHYPQTC